MGTSKPESIHVSATFGAVSKLQKFLLYCKASNSFQHCQSQEIKIAVVIKNNLTDTHKHTHTKTYKICTLTETMQVKSNEFRVSIHMNIDILIDNRFL